MDTFCFSLTIFAAVLSLLHGQQQQQQQQRQVVQQSWYPQQQVVQQQPQQQFYYQPQQQQTTPRFLPIDFSSSGSNSGFRSATIRYTANFMLNGANTAVFRPQSLSADSAVDTSPDEGEASVNVLILRQPTFTTVITFGLSASRMTVLQARSYDFDVTIQLRSLQNSAQPISIGGRAVFKVDQGYYTPNPTLTLRWPLSYQTLMQQYASQNGAVILDVVAVVSNPNTATPVLPATTPNPYVARPINSWPYQQQIGSRKK